MTLVDVRSFSDEALIKYVLEDADPSNLLFPVLVDLALRLQALHESVEEESNGADAGG